MTLLVCLQGSDGMVLATDSRGTFGDPRGVTAQNDNQKKLYQASDHVGIMVAGSGELGAEVMEHILDEVQKKKTDGAREVLGIVRNQAKGKYYEWFKSFLIQPTENAQAPVRPDLAMIVAGFDVDKGKHIHQKAFQITSSLDFAPMQHNYGFALAGIAQYALYLLNRLYEGDRGVDDLVRLAVYVITETATQDGKVGGPVQLMTIKPDGSKMYTLEEVNEVVAKNTNIADATKAMFYKVKE